MNTFYFECIPFFQVYFTGLEYVLKFTYNFLNIRTAKISWDLQYLVAWNLIAKKRIWAKMSQFSYLFSIMKMGIKKEITLLQHISVQHFLGLYLNLELFFYGKQNYCSYCLANQQSLHCTLIPDMLHLKVR